MSETQHTKRFTSRKQVLQSYFTVSKLQDSWKNYVKEGMRKQSIQDLHDYYDFDRNKTTILEKYVAEILSGTYKPKRPLTARIEKKLGLTRRISIPSVEDAVILQTLMDQIRETAIAKQPSKNAFYSRSHGFKPKAKQPPIDYLWFKNWKRFSKRRFHMVEDNPYTCITDIANYYDNIDFRQLRHILSSVCSLEEVILDFIFLMIEGVSWRPDYLPSSGKGLVQADFDAPRLLSHIFLYEIDSFLAERTDDTFTRWVDDITVPSPSIQAAKCLLRDLDELLLTRGLRLNSGKTVILTPNEANEYLWHSENHFLDRVDKIVEKKKSYPYKKIRGLATKRYFAFIDKNQIGYWDKVYKRYFTLFGKLKDGILEEKVPTLLKTMPSIRNNIFAYYETLGPSTNRLEHIKTFLLSYDCLDDSAIFAACKLITSWKLPHNSDLIPAVIKLGETLSNKALIARSEVYFIGSLWILSKYSPTETLFKRIQQNKTFWRKSEFLSRQVAATYPLIKNHPRFYKEVELELIHYEQIAALGVILHFRELEKMQLIHGSIRLYLLHGTKDNTKKINCYPLQKFLILRCFLESKALHKSDKSKLKAALLQRLEDPILLDYLMHLESSI